MKNNVVSWIPWKPGGGPFLRRGYHEIAIANSEESDLQRI